MLAPLACLPAGTRHWMLCNMHRLLISLVGELGGQESPAGLRGAGVQRHLGGGVLEHRPVVRAMPALDLLEKGSHDSKAASTRVPQRVVRRIAGSTARPPSPERAERRQRAERRPAAVCPLGRAASAVFALCTVT